jgi:hypothetical protein
MEDLMDAKEFERLVLERAGLERLPGGMQISPEMAASMDMMEGVHGVNLLDEVASMVRAEAARMEAGIKGEHCDEKAAARVPEWGDKVWFAFGKLPKSVMRGVVVRIMNPDVVVIASNQDEQQYVLGVDQVCFTRKELVRRMREQMRLHLAMWEAETEDEVGDTSTHRAGVWVAPGTSGEGQGGPLLG